MSGALYDKNRREIRRGDVVKVYHFTGANRKRFYMYKQALGPVRIGGGSATEYMRFDHLELKDTSYVEALDGRVLREYEIVQATEALWERDRPRLALSKQEGGNG